MGILAPRAAALLLVALGPGAAHGRIWIVDAAGGPGSSFTDIPPALLAAQDGDTILVRSGTYDGGTVTRGIALIAETGAIVNVRLPGGFLGAALTVSGLPAGRTVVLDGLRPALSSVPLPGSFLEFRGCAGRIHCDNLDGNLFSQTTGQPAAGVIVTDCAHVSIHASSLRAGSPVSALRSTLLITDCVLSGQNGFTGLGGAASSSPALRSTDCRVTIARSALTGGSGAFLGFQSPSAAISAAGGSFVIAGGSEASIVAGTNYGRPNPPSAIGGSGAALTIDPRVTLTPDGGAPPIAAGHVALFRRVPSLSAAAGPPGGTLDLDLLATSGDLGELYFSLPFGPLPAPIPVSGSIWVDPSALIVLGRFAVSGSETMQVSFPIPAALEIRGAALSVQGATWSAATGLGFSTPATFVLN